MTVNLSEDAFLISKDDTKAEKFDLNECSEIDKSSGMSNIMDGLTAFIPWTGFDYTSDGDFDEDEVDDLTDKGAGAKKKRKRTNQKQPTADADLIASATEENLRKLGIDPNSNEGKKQRRKIRNRLSAQLHRERKKGYISYLEGLVNERDARLAAVSIRMKGLYRENMKLRSKLGYRRSKGMDLDYSSTATAGHTDSDTGEDSDTVSVSSNEAATLMPNISSRGITIGTRFKGSKIGSTVSLFSAVLMISITLFGPNIQNVNPSNEVTADKTGGTLNVMAFKDDVNGNLLSPSDQTAVTKDNNMQLIAPHVSRRLLSASSALLSQNLNDFIKQPDVYTRTQVPSDVTKSLVPSVNRYEIAGQRIPSSGPSQSLWQYRDHITDLYPPVVRYYRSDKDINNNNYTVQMRVSRHLRTRDERNVTLSAHTPSVVQRRYEDRSDQSITKPNQNKIYTEEVNTGEDEDGSMGKTLVPVFLQPVLSQSKVPEGISSPRHSNQQSIPSIDYTTTSTSTNNYKSMSRVLLTQGRALLDPSLVDAPLVDRKNNVVQTGEKDTVATSLIKTLSTWTSSGQSGQSGIKPPVVQVGVNAMGTSPSSESNMLVMLLPASSVRWGRNWGDSTEGTMEAMLKGLNFTGTDGDGTYAGNANTEKEEGMWVEIGCSVFRAHLVRNVTLSS